MSNINVNRMKTDLEDNKASNRYQPTGIDYRGIAVVSVVILGFLALIWLVTLAVTSAGCGLGSITLCNDFHTVFWLFIYLIGGITGIAVMFAVPFVYQKAKNSAFLNHLGIFIHRDDVRSSTDKAYESVYRMAESEYLRGADAVTFSPSTHNSSTTKEADKGMSVADAFVFSDEVPFDKVLE